MQYRGLLLLVLSQQSNKPLAMFWRRHSQGSDNGNDSSSKSRLSNEAQGDEEVNILRYLNPDCIRMQLEFTPREIPEDESEAQVERRLLKDKEDALQEMADILDASGQIVNPTKFYKDMLNRERKATTAIAPGIAIPHVRSMQVRSFVMGFARAPGDGIPFASLDGKPSKLFFMLASPPYEDKLYLKIYRQFAEMIRHDWVYESFLDAETPQDILNILRGYISQ